MMSILVGREKESAAMFWRLAIKPFLAGALFLLPTAVYGGVAIANSELNASTPEISLSFQGVNVHTLTNVSTGEKYITQVGPGWFDMDLQRPTGETLAPGAWQIVTDAATGSNVGQLLVSDSVRQVILTVGTDPATNEIFVRVQGTSTQAGLRSILWGIQGFSAALGKFVIPAHAGIQFDGTTNPSLLQMEYPTHWESQFLLYDTSKGGVLIYARDPVPNFKRVQASNRLGTLDAAFETFSVAPWTPATSVPVIEWRIKAFSGSWKGAVDFYRNWSQTALPAGPGQPDWVQQISAVITVTNPDPAYLQPLAQVLVPSKTLLYLVNWRSNAFDVDYPDYTSAAITQTFVQQAQQLGFRVMLHANAIGVSTYNALYQQVSQNQLRDADTGDLVYWPWGLWPGGSTPPALIQSFAFISPGSSTFRAALVKALAPAIASVKPDAIHLDAGGVLLNDGNGLIENMNSIQGMIHLLQDLSAAFPGLALSYESTTEFLVPLLSFAQRWAADFSPHPVSAYLMGQQVKFYGFLNQAQPDQPGFIPYIKKYESQGVMPTITINSLDDVVNPPYVASRVYALMRSWQENGFQPDWSGDWTGLDFRYISEDGSTSATVEDSGTRVRMNIGGNIVYERAKNVTSTAASSSFVPNWTGYDSANIYGLDPSQEFWLEDGRSRPNALHLANVPSNVSLGTGTFVGSGYGYFELNQIASPAFDFVEQFAGAKTGVDYLRRDYPLGAGAIAEVTRTTIAGQLQSPVILMLPPYELRGSAVFVDYQVPVPSNSQVSLTFGAGISDFGVGSDGAFFLIRINGQDQWSRKIPLGQLVPASIDLTPWGGQTIQLRFIVQPGPYLNPVGDLACWTNPTLTISANANPVAFNVVVPDGSPPALTSGNVTLGATGTEQYYAAQATPSAAPPAGQTGAWSSFEIFGVQPPQIAIGTSLLDLPFDVMQKGYGGWAVPGGVSSSGVIQPITSGGVLITKAIPTIPPPSGLTEIAWPVQLPSNASQLSFSVGFADPTPPLPSTITYSPVALTLRINGQAVWTTTLQTNGWIPNNIDISPWQGQNVVIVLDADGLGEGLFNWAHWAGLTVN